MNSKAYDKWGMRRGVSRAGKMNSTSFVLHSFRIKNKLWKITQEKHTVQSIDKNLYIRNMYVYFIWESIDPSTTKPLLGLW